MGLVKLDGYQCDRCGHTWLPRDHAEDEQALPTVCPKCKSPYWNKPRQQEPAAKRKRKP
jgi:DNA-directed RNA polymerase subunit RPC12/RpoP